MQLYPTILAFDTTGTQDSITLYHKGMVSGKTLLSGGSRLQSSILIPELQTLLSNQKLVFKDIDVLATVSGPGSFTGIRIGLATAQGLLIAGAYRPVVPTLLELLAFSAGQKKPSSKILSLVDNKRGDFFCQVFHPDLTPSAEATIMNITEIQHLKEPLTMVGTQPVAALPDLVIPKESVAELLIEFCLKIALTDTGDRYQQVAPFYIRHPEFKKQKRFL